MAAGLVLNSPQLPTIHHPARRLPSVLMGPVCPWICSASAVTYFTVVWGEWLQPGRACLHYTRAAVFLLAHVRALGGADLFPWKILHHALLAVWVVNLHCKREARCSVKGISQALSCYCLRNPGFCSALQPRFKLQGCNSCPFSISIHSLEIQVIPLTSGPQMLMCRKDKGCKREKQRRKERLQCSQIIRQFPVPAVIASELQYPEVLFSFPFGYYDHAFKSLCSWPNNPFLWPNRLRTNACQPQVFYLLAFILLVFFFLMLPAFKIFICWDPGPKRSMPGTTLEDTSSLRTQFFSPGGRHQQTITP